VGYQIKKILADNIATGTKRMLSLPHKAQKKRPKETLPKRKKTVFLLKTKGTRAYNPKEKTPLSHKAYPLPSSLTSAAAT
jgi:hypothetical protein